ncbi:unnamed protein product [Caretta caretta]
MSDTKTSSLCKMTFKQLEDGHWRVPSVQENSEHVEIWWRQFLSQSSCTDMAGEGKGMLGILKDNIWLEEEGVI